MAAALLFSGITSAGGEQPRLRHVAPHEIADRSVPACSLQTKEECAAAVEEENQRRQYFFDTGVDEWYNDLADQTFRSAFIELKPEEARAITRHWLRVHYREQHNNNDDNDDDDDTQKTEEDNNDDDDDSSSSSNNADADDEILLQAVSARIEDCIRAQFNATGAFVKLSTRSPKDSKSAFAHASRLWREGGAEDESNNDKLVRLMNCSARSLKVDTGEGAMALMLDSERVWEDLVFALEDPNKWNVCVTVREFHPDVTIDTEFRGFVWGGELTCLSQYAHPLHFPRLLAPGVEQQIANDCRAFFTQIKGSIPLDRYIVDFCWMGGSSLAGGNGGVILVEVNPFDGVLGSFPCSTGLFSWEDDREVMTNGPFELRLRHDCATEDELRHQMSTSWRKLIYGY